MEGCVQENPVYDWKDSRLRRASYPGPLDQQASAYPTELPGLLYSNGKEFSPTEHFYSLRVGPC